ncbi:MAG: recombination protein RecR [Betaproteobacteria bacterium TMED82]|jgi:recombination protein RecR|nr:MAG: recombination protein RecR [Betaproteobacteria bacterium TMED82]|tara:strand:+ start:118586 stop:119200 length:615 start_codon:yes stop_codon:yes gene_type:complete
MKYKAPLALQKLADAFVKLPGVGPKTAQRNALHLMQYDRGAALKLSEALAEALESLKNCKNCNTFCEDNICELCVDATRDRSKLCIVESPSDLLALEQSQAFNGLYFVLLGKISPIDGVGPKELKFENLMARLSDDLVTEVILATNFTPEGQATAYAIELLLEEQDSLKKKKVSRLARGVPHGAELEFTDLGTIAQAVRERKTG